MGGKAKKVRYEIRKHLRKVKGLKTWQFILILIPFLVLAATFLRFDHIKMTELKHAVIEADANGDETAIYNNLEQLKQFTFSNIVVNIVDNNGVQELTFGTGPFYLEHQYARDVQKTIEQATAAYADDSNPNGNIYSAATAVCQPIAIRNGWTWDNPNYLECITNELNKYPEMKNLSDGTVQLPSTELYRFNFASPIWAPTWAGFTILICLVLIIIIVVRIIIWLILRLSLLILKISQKK